MSGLPGRRQVPRFGDRQPCPPVRNMARLDTTVYSRVDAHPGRSDHFSRSARGTGRNPARLLHSRHDPSGRYHPPPETVGKLLRNSIARSARRSRVHADTEPVARAAGEQPPRESTTRCRLVAARRFAACLLPGSCRAANADGPAGADGRIGNEHARGRAAWPLAQAARRAVRQRRPSSSKIQIGTRLLGHWHHRVQLKYSRDHP